MTNKKLLTAFIALVFMVAGYAQQKTITGTVTSDGEPLPGANIVVQGTSIGAQSDFDGNYTIEASEGDVLVFSYIGMVTQTIPVNTTSIINVIMLEDTNLLDEVVVTALGIKREKKSLTYATQNVGADEISKARPVNLVNGLSGKVAGISINRSGGGVGSASKVTLRGLRSIAGSSDPIYVIDGVVVGGGIDNISPDDIESISVLKGPNAAALYGSSANNGAIVVNTKSGSGGKGFAVTLSTTLTAETAHILTDYQNEYGQGIDGSYNPNTTFSWGPQFDGSQVAHWSNNPDFGTSTYAYEAQPNNVKDFFATGFNLATNLSISTNNENTSTYFSYTNTDVSGIVPGNDLEGHNFSVRVNTEIAEKLRVDAKLNYIKQNIDNQYEEGESFANPIRHAVRLPRNIRTEDVSIFDFVDPTNGSTLQHFWVPGDNGGANPYWTANRNISELTRDRIITAVTLDYDLAKGLSIQARASLDKVVESKYTSWYNDSYIIADNGDYFTRNFQSQAFNGDLLLKYNGSINEDFKFNINGGGNLNKGEFRSVDTRNNGLNVANIFGVNNASAISVTQEFEPQEVQSVYGFGQLSYKNALFLDVTARNDWSSTLPAANRSYFYPSVGLTAVVSDLIKLPEVFSFLKLRANWAQVGNDTDPFRLTKAVNLEQGTIAGSFLEFDVTDPALNLRPEQTESIEVGLDVRLLENRVGLDLTYYKSNSTDQLFLASVTGASGASNRFINGGDIENKGVEAILNIVPVRTDNFNWDLTLNFAKNTSEVLALADGIDELSIEEGDDFFFRRYILKVGNPFGDVYSRGFVRDDQGRVVVGANGVPLITDDKNTAIANFNPDWSGGIRNSFTYKDFNMSFLIDIRQGGSVASFTQAILASDGATSQTLVGRDGTAIFGQNVFSGETAVKEDGSPNDIQVSAQELWTNLGGRNTPVGEAFVRDASNVRLRELILGYSLPSNVTDRLPFESVSFSLVGRNLFFLSNKAGDIDPEVVSGTDNGAEGFESFSPPTTKSFGFNIKIGF
ncbi:MAG: SusC/RagA family TonB-linked outer membrane protein [Flavobacteriaceae bacterium]